MSIKNRTFTVVDDRPASDLSGRGQKLAPLVVAILNTVTTGKAVCLHLEIGEKHNQIVGGMTRTIQRKRLQLRSRFNRTDSTLTLWAEPRETEPVL